MQVLPSLQVFWLPLFFFFKDEYQAPKIPVLLPSFTECASFGKEAKQQHFLLDVSFLMLAKVGHTKSVLHSQECPYIHTVCKGNMTGTCIDNLKFVLCILHVCDACIHVPIVEICLNALPVGPLK